MATAIDSSLMQDVWKRIEILIDELKEYENMSKYNAPNAIGAVLMIICVNISGEDTKS